MADVGAAGIPAEGPVGPGGGPEAKDSVAGWRVEGRWARGWEGDWERDGGDCKGKGTGMKKTRQE